MVVHAKYVKQSVSMHGLYTRNIKTGKDHDHKTKLTVSCESSEKGDPMMCNVKSNSNHSPIHHWCNDENTVVELSHDCTHEI